MIAFLIAATSLPFQLKEKGRDVDFRYRWAAEAAAIPSLQRKLRAELRTDRARTAARARADRQSALKANYPFHQHFFDRSITFGGQSARLASFADQRSTYTGGAHPNSGTTTILWDRQRGAETSFRALFRNSPAAILRPAYCKGLAAERQRKMGSAKPSGIYGETCPDPLKLTIIPEDKNRDGRFDVVNVTADPYAVGSYAEGYYIVMLPVTRALIAALKPEFRASFDSQRQ
jgi:hypothetical protein